MPRTSSSTAALGACGHVTIRYQELAEDGEHVVGSLYVRKAELARLGDPRELTVIVRATSADAAAA